MTDNEIIEALECCRGDYSTDCDNCPNKKTCDEIDVVSSAIDLINRQKAEIERLEKEKQDIKDKYDCQQTVYYDLSNIIREKCKELNKYPIKTVVNNNCEIHSKTSKDYDNLMADIKSEAIKEFAERLKKLKIKPEFPWDDYCVSEGNIDNLVKEMTEVQHDT